MSGSTSNNNVIGCGSDSIVLRMAGDQAQGVDPKFSVNVDGRQIGGVQVASASHANGQEQTFTFLGNWDAGSHDVTVTFANNFLYPGSSGDRNLWIEGISYNGQAVSNTSTPIYQSPMFPPNSTVGNIYGNKTYSVNDTTPESPGESTPTTTPGAVTIGSGADTLVLNMAEDPYLGDAQFTVSMDGHQIGGTQTTTANVQQGQQQQFNVRGDFGSGTHKVTVNFLNDQIGEMYPPGTPGLPPGEWAVDTTDRNLYVMGASINGGPQPSNTPWELSSQGSFDWYVTAGSNQNASQSTSDVAPITSSSVSAGDTGNASSSGMNFVAPGTGTPDTTASTGTTGTTPSAGETVTATNTASNNSTTDTTGTLSSTLTNTPVATPDPTVTTQTATADPTSTRGGSGSSWWANHHTWNGSSWDHHHG
jgi:Ca-dependent carbohydrate-binding module xylan-binding